MEWVTCGAVSSLSFEVLIKTLGSWPLRRNSRKGRWIVQGWWIDSASRSQILDLCTGIQEAWFLLMAPALPNGWGEFFARSGPWPPLPESFRTETSSCFPGNLGISVQALFEGLVWADRLSTSSGTPAPSGRAIRPALGSLLLSLGAIGFNW